MTATPLEKAERALATAAKRLDYLNEIEPLGLTEHGKRLLRVLAKKRDLVQDRINCLNAADPTFQLAYTQWQSRLQDTTTFMHDIENATKNKVAVEAEISRLRGEVTRLKRTR